MTESTGEMGVPVTETAEFKAAVEAATAKAMAAAVPEIVAQLAKAQGAPVSLGDQSWAEGLAMAIAQLNDQGSGRKRVAPEVLQAREKARERMTVLIIQAKADAEMPLYHLRNKVYLDECLLEPVYLDPASKEPRPTEIGWPGVPSEAMKPANETANAIYEAFSESIGSTSWQKPEDKFGITPGGLVVKNGAVQPKRALPSANGQIQTEGLQVMHRRGPIKGKTINVLGTVAAPAQQGIA